MTITAEELAYLRLREKESEEAATAYANDPSSENSYTAGKTFGRYLFALQKHAPKLFAAAEDFLSRQEASPGVAQRTESGSSTIHVAAPSKPTE